VSIANPTTVRACTFRRTLDIHWDLKNLRTDLALDALEMGIKPAAL